MNNDDDDSVYSYRHRQTPLNAFLAVCCSLFVVQVKVALHTAPTAHLVVIILQKILLAEVAYSDGMRTLFTIPRGECKSDVCDCRREHIQALLRNLMFKFMQHLEKPTNSAISTLKSQCEFSHDSPTLRAHWQECLYVN